MDMACEAEFIGGPADGQLHAFPGDEPPGEVRFSIPVSWSQFHDFVYTRRVSRRDEGPLWVYVPKSKETP
jgi:hypothetical protein